MKSKEQRKKEAREDYDKTVAKDWVDCAEKLAKAREERDKKRAQALEDYMKKCKEIDEDEN